MENVATTKKCPFCAEEILADAAKCKHCGEWLNQKHKFDCEIIDRNGKKLKWWFEAFDEEAVKAHVKNKGWQLVSIEMRKEPKEVVVRNNKNPGVALLLSFIMPGFGQWYNGQAGKGFAFLIGFWILVWTVIGGIAIWIWGMADAYGAATKINEGQGTKP